MKKIIKLLFSIIILFTCVSCNTNNDKFMLEGNINNTNTIELEGIDLKDKIEKQENFVLVIMLESCSSCEEFKNEILIPYIKESKATIYSIFSYKLDAMERFDNKPRYKLAPNIQVYNKGESVSSKNYNEKDEAFKSLQGFKEYMNEYVLAPSLIEVSEEYLDSQIKDKKTFILYIGWDKCGDCVAINENVINKYLLDNASSISFYYLESDKYRSKKPSSRPILSEFPTNEELEALANYEAWIAFASKYNFVSYNDGRIPTLQYYKDGVMQEMIVYKNDVIVDNIINKSFYKELENTIYDETNINKFHNDKVIEFLDKYYK